MKEHDKTDTGHPEIPSFTGVFIDGELQVDTIKVAYSTKPIALPKLSALNAGKFIKSPVMTFNHK